MSKEAMKLALEALEYIHNGANNQGPHTGISWRCVSNKAEPVITALREALAKPDFWEGYVPEPVKPSPVPWSQALEDVWAEQPAQQALDKKAENARELGLDYEPFWGGGPTNKDYEDAMRQRRLHQLTTPPAQRKPLTVEELKAKWNAQSDHMNQWEELGLDEIVLFAQEGDL